MLERLLIDHGNVNGRLFDAGAVNGFDLLVGATTMKVAFPVDPGLTVPSAFKTTLTLSK